jgi:hypothetical protein
VRPPQLICRLRIIQLDVQILIDALQCAADADFILQLYGNFMLDERLEETAFPALAFVFLGFSVTGE